MAVIIDISLGALNPLIPNLGRLKITNNNSTRFFGTNLDDFLFSFAGNDSVSGGAGDDFIDTGAGRDTINTGPGDDVIYAGAGDDTIRSNGAGNKKIFGGTGTDTVTYFGLNSSTGITVDLITGVADKHTDGIDFLYSIENVFGTNESDLLIGDNDPNELRGNDGADRLFGNGGNDNLLGSGGNDTLVGGLGSDDLNGGFFGGGGGGRDTIVYQSPLDGGTTGDRLVFQGAGPAPRDKIELSVIGFADAGFDINTGGDPRLLNNSDADLGGAGFRYFSVNDIVGGIGVRAGEFYFDGDGVWDSNDRLLATIQDNLTGNAPNRLLAGNDVVLGV